MTTNRIIEMIDEYLEEPNSIDKEWVECLRLCKQAILENEIQKAEIEKLKDEKLKHFLAYEKDRKRVKSESIKEFAERSKKEATVDEDLTWWIANIDVDNLVKEMAGE